MISFRLKKIRPSRRSRLDEDVDFNLVIESSLRLVHNQVNEPQTLTWTWQKKFLRLRQCTKLEQVM